MTQHLWKLVFLTAACTGEISSGDDEGGGSGSGIDPETCVASRSYVGFGGGPLEGDRVEINAGSDRLRLKPFAALATEYARALGLPEVDTSAYAATFGRPPARWYEEPLASSSTIYASFALAYEACGKHTATGDIYAAAPDRATADANCRALALRAWHHDASEPEVEACVSFAVDQTNAADPPRTRWAYTCAAVLTASSFLTY